jgi:hypothetical protein
MPLEKDIGFLRDWSNNLDSSYCGQGWYDKAVRPIAHATYHGAQAVISLNGAELARAADQVNFFAILLKWSKTCAANKENYFKFG